MSEETTKPEPMMALTFTRAFVEAAAKHTSEFYDHGDCLGCHVAIAARKALKEPDVIQQGRAQGLLEAAEDVRRIHKQNPESIPLGLAFAVDRLIQDFERRAAAQAIQRRAEETRE